MRALSATSRGNKKSAQLPQSLLLADDDPLVRTAVKAIFGCDPTFKVTGDATDGEQAMARALQLHPDLLVLDMNMPGKAGLETLRELHQAIPGKGALAMRTLLLTVSADRRQIMEAIQLGARGLVLKHNAPTLLLRAAHSVLAGRFWIDTREFADIHEVLRELSAGQPKTPTAKRDLLTPRELSIVKLLAQGCTNKDIANQTGTKEQVIKNNLVRIFDKLGVFNRLELALYALDNQIVDRA